MMLSHFFPVILYSQVPTIDTSNGMENNNITNITNYITKTIMLYSLFFIKDVFGV